jgi:hypothetical protein
MYKYFHLIYKQRNEKLHFNYQEFSLNKINEIKLIIKNKQ